MPASKREENQFSLWERLLTALPRAFIQGIDAVLRRVNHVQEFTDDRWCLIRIALTKSNQDIVLSDGTRVTKGEIIGELHLWNEHIPSMPRSGPDFAWGVRAYSLLVRSFRALAQYTAMHPELSRIRAWRGESSFLPKGMGLPNLFRRLGFDVVRSESQSNLLRKFVDFWENFYWWMLAWAFNPASLIYKELLKMERWEVWLSSARLQEKYGNSRNL
nr:hypothetical protein [Chloroflexota bacterium]